MFKPTSYKCIPWTFDKEGQLIVGTSFKSWSNTKQEWYSKAHLWFNDDCLNQWQWAYEGQREKLLAVLSEWCLIHSKNTLESCLATVCLDKALDRTTDVEFLFEEKVLFGGQPSLTLIEVINDIKHKFICVDT